jgi:GT2 family glycosyltransferase/glycosyltransferase involved in cell wall biosynthesis
MISYKEKFKELVRKTPLGPPLRTAWRRVRGTNGRPHRTIEQMKAEISLQSMYRLQDFLISGATLPFPEVEHPLVSVILVLYNRAELTFRCLRSLKENSHLPLEVIAIDNGSSDLSQKIFDRITGVHYVRNPENRHFLRATNQGAQLARGKYLLLLNNDTEPTPGAIDVAVNALESDPSLGAVGGRLILPDGTLQEAGCFVWNDGTCRGYGRGDDPTSGPYMFPRLVDFCSGAFLLTPRSLWNELGGLDEAFTPAYYEEADYCMRLWQGGRPVRYEPRAAVWHYEFASSPDSDSPTLLMRNNRQLFAERHARVLKSRPKPGSVPELMMRSRSPVSKPKVLFCDQLLPHPKKGSGFPRANRMVRSLLDLGCEVSCLPTSLEPGDWVSIAEDIPPEAEILAHWCYRLDAFPTVFAERQGYYDCLIVSRPITMSLIQPLLTKHPEWFKGMSLVYDAEAIFAVREVRQERLEGKSVSDEEVESRVARELASCAGFQKVLAVSREEAACFAEHGFHAELVGHAATIAPGETAWAERQDILFVGTIAGDGVPNADAVSWFLNEVWPELHRRLPWSRFVIAGLNRSRRLNSQPLAEGVVVTGAVDDLTPLYNRARIFVAPTRASSGIPLKVIEAAGMGLPVVATPLLISQLGWDTPREILGAEAGAEFADACATLCTNERAWQLQRDAALARVTAEYSPAVFSEQLRRALDLPTAADPRG